MASNKTQTTQDTKPDAPAPETETAPVPAPAAPDPTPADQDGRRAYTVTKMAGPRVAGQRVTKGQTLRLTPAQARSELLNQSITPKGAKTAG